MRRKSLKCLVLTCGVALLAAAALPAAASPAGHDWVYFLRSAVQTREPQKATLEIERALHGEVPATVDLKSVSGGTADVGVDYQSLVKTIQFQEGYEQTEAMLTVIDDSSEEPIETVNVRLENPTNGMVRVPPYEAVISIVDNDGSSRVAFEFPQYSSFENRPLNDPKIEIFVLRAGNISGSMTVHYETQDGTATSPEDFQQTSGNLEFGANEWLKRITIPLTNNNVGESTENFLVDLSNPTGGAVVTPSVDVTIFDEDSANPPDDTPPITAFHAPLDGGKYRPRALETMLGIMQDGEDGSGMDRVQLGIRKKMSDGSCRWWNGSRFRSGGCDEKRWAKTGRDTETTVEYFTDTFVFTLDKLLRSSARGTGIRNYTAFCRGWDEAGNVQSIFDKGQNKNTFEVR
ncbi:MAG: hypothetical protein M3280_03470 [Actinomycetota bacterium]|nr:hypothetical protein [Actinomycetota bacterium]